ncbi:MAG: protein-disulfide reductase DsbD [Ferrovum sp.]|nr:protein-disulfide reductase DsbD [Ferrovum sp.]
MNLARFLLLSSALRVLPLAGGLLLATLVALPSSATEGLSFNKPALPAALVSSNAPKTFLMPEEAFKVSVSTATAQSLVIQFTPAPGYYLYRDRIKVLGSSETPLGQLAFPQAESKQDPSFGHVWVYHQPFAVDVSLPAAPPRKLAITYQGCAEQGICYPPTTQHFVLASATGSYQPATGSSTPLDSAPDINSANPNEFLSFLKGAKPLLVLASFFGFGLLLSMTPCVFPMIPILSGIIAGQGSSITKSRAFGLSLTYVLGMSLTYALAGILAGLSGTLLSNALQTPPVQIGTAILFVILALSMFDVYQLQLPPILQNGLNTLSSRLPGGRYLGVGLMGILSALVMGPCVAAPLAGGLLYIAQTHNVALGGAALFILALGMGVPLLVIGTSAGALLPRAGRWMVWVKRFFGVLLLGVAFWMVMPLLGSRLGTNGPHFDRVASTTALDQALAKAVTDGRPVLLDFYADWCVSCVEMEKKVFPTPAVKATLEKGILLRADVTQNTAEDQALLARFGLFGPPGTIFFGSDGQEISDGRLVGYVPAQQFLDHLNKVFR